MISGFKTKKIRSYTLGEKLRSARKKKGMSLEQAEHKTKVRIKYLKALEQNNYSVLPAQVYAVGFLEKYCDCLNLSRKKYLLEFKRSLNSWRSLQKDTLRPKRSVRDRRVIITPKFIFSALTGLVVVSLTGYIWLQVRSLTAPPKLVIITPNDTAKVDLANIEIKGRTDPGVIVKINDQKIEQNDNGKFQEVIALRKGVNTFKIVAINRFNKKQTKTIKILRTQNVGQNQEEQQGE